MNIRKLALIVAVSINGVKGQEVESAPKQEVGLPLGRLFGVNRSGQLSKLELGSGTALQAIYGYRLVERSDDAIYGEVHFLANPQRKVSSQDQTPTRDVATIIVTPGLRLKLLPRKALAPYFVVGAGYAAFEQSPATLGAKPNAASRELSRGAFDFGGGVDVRF